MNDQNSDLANRSISVTLDDQDIEDLRDILKEGKSCGIIEHILQLVEEKTEKVDA